MDNQQSLGRAAEIAAISDDLPALGNPTSAISATDFNSRVSVRSSPGSPSRQILVRDVLMMKAQIAKIHLAHRELLKMLYRLPTKSANLHCPDSS
jgi:hypothetical protein